TKMSLPKACIIVSNHKSLLDFALYLLVFPFRTIRFLMAEVLYNKGKLFSFLLNSWGGLRVDRDDHDFSFVSECIEILDKGGTVGVFPEARLPINGKPFPFTTSTAFIAMHASAPIVPVYTDGNYGLFKRAGVFVGEPFYLTDFAKEGLDTEAQIAHLTEVLQEKVMGLKEPLQTKKAQHRLFDLRHIPMDLARLVCAILVPLLRIKKVTPEGEKYTEKIKGGAIVAANHTSFADPFVVGVSFWYRRLHFLVAEVVMKGKLRSWLLRGVGAIKIDRGTTDLEAINQSVSKLKAGYLLAIFPQGKIEKEDNVDTIKAGAVLMALRAGVPIVPMHIMSRPHWYTPRTVVVGKAIHPADYCQKKMPSTADIKNVTDALLAELNRCKSANCK
ncbi:MAG: 1-acyl-sn-glycerol-3-phosphate acyltransferase, partial [Clostridia bacterium]|nr:1-acyl-sn-glycerol-3-phosphate acyltransferase [Clostridia bacterium]